ncbi:hypothetical protein BP6252_08326 [Coleophoma cylindrospora]|uniref:Mitochondrial intermembrane space import and assembly protein 40 n=1 Tax=Coleophoma cylindrospora TaxID=1849047 RepID=A0A3D8R5M6_9HELO|nr:hypothetical protein BP6252_08326 [Coleophoma cylindrospora]
MFKSAVRAAPRRITTSRAFRSPQRFLSTAPPTQKSRSWKNSAVRWGIAVAGVYYYNTSNVFAEEPEGEIPIAIQQLGDSIQAAAESSLPTVEAIVEEKRRRQAEQLAQTPKEQESTDAPMEQAEGEEDGLEGLEEEAGQQGAFNPETGEINWDCPCLGGMAHGPCGPEFREAFSCFVYSKEEPKGVECIEKFKGMQDCFREHPEMYGSELEDDEDEVEEELRAREQAKIGDEASAPKAISAEASEKADEPHRDNKTAPVASSAGPSDEDAQELVPRASHDASPK